MQAGIEFNLPLYNRGYMEVKQSHSSCNRRNLRKQAWYNTSTKEEKPARHPQIITIWTLCQNFVKTLSNCAVYATGHLLYSRISEGFETSAGLALFHEREHTVVFRIVGTFFSITFSFGRNTIFHGLLTQKWKISVIIPFLLWNRRKL